VEDLLLLLGARLGVAGLQALLHPPALGALVQVHVLDTDRAAIRVPQQAEDVAQPGLRGAAQTAGREGPVEVPQREAVVLDVEIRVATLPVGEGIGVGHEMAAGAVGVDELGDPGRLAEFDLGVHVAVLGPAHRLVGHA